jgi:hypothetical protein
LPAVTCLLTVGSFESIVIAHRAQYSPDNNVAESVQVQDVMNSETSVLGTNLINYRTIEIFRSSLVGLEEVYSLCENGSGR